MNLSHVYTYFWWKYAQNLPDVRANALGSGVRTSCFVGSEERTCERTCIEGLEGHTKHYGGLEGLGAMGRLRGEGREFGRFYFRLSLPVRSLTLSPCYSSLPNNFFLSILRNF
eukprot:1340538-Amorphochlora_amoeboformis.AAC.2